jgi:hypothetical protein
MKQVDEAEECVTCEAHLKLGIQAFEWVVDADTEYRRFTYKFPGRYNPAIQELIESLFIAWTGSCEHALKWASKNESLGFDVSHLEDFKRCCIEATAIIESFQDRQSDRIMAGELVTLRDEALAEHRNGETAEFFSGE